MIVVKADPTDIQIADPVQAQQEEGLAAQKILPVNPNVVGGGLPVILAEVPHNVVVNQQNTIPPAVPHQVEAEQKQGAGENAAGYIDTVSTKNNLKPLMISLELEL